MPEADGRVEDVTRWTLFTSANESAVQVSPEGVAKTVGYGEGAVTAWYLSKVTTASITVPMDEAPAAATFCRAPSPWASDAGEIDSTTWRSTLIHAPTSPPAASGGSGS